MKEWKYGIFIEFYNGFKSDFRRCNEFVLKLMFFIIEIFFKILDVKDCVGWVG